MTTSTDLPAMFRLLHPDQTLFLMQAEMFGRTIEENLVYLGEQITALAAHLRTVPASKFKREDSFTIGWRLRHVVGVARDWDVLEHTDPKHAGILCQTTDPDAPLLLTSEELSPLHRDHLAALYELDAWRSCIGCVWAARLVRQLLVTLRQPQLMLPGEVSTAPTSLEETRPLGALLNLGERDGEELTNLEETCTRARLGSAACEHGLALAFLSWAKRATLDTFESCGLTASQTRTLLDAIDQHYALADLQLAWVQETRGYELVFSVKNRDQHGYERDDLSAGVSARILGQFYAEVRAEHRVDLVRLALRAYWKLAGDLSYGAIDNDLD